METVTFNSTGLKLTKYNIRIKQTSKTLKINLKKFENTHIMAVVHNLPLFVIIDMFYVS